MKNSSKNFKYEFVTKCQICKSKKLDTIHSFGFHPTVNDFKKSNVFFVNVNHFPLKLLVCKKCELVQLNVVIESKTIFPNNYAYRSGTTKLLINNFNNLRKEIDKKNLLKTGDLVIDIGSNDGTLLSNFKSNYNILGIEPTDVSKIANKKGIKTINMPFDFKLSNKIKNKYGKAKLITATNVFAHIENVHNVMSSIKNLLHNDGVFVSESHYLFDLVSTLQYDTVYHEHLRYYSINSLSKLFSYYNMEIFDVTKIKTHGGSIRVYAGIKNKHTKSNQISNFRNKELKGNSLFNKLKKFSSAVSRSKLKLNKLIYEKKLKNKTIVGISAPSRSSTLINFLGLDHNIIDYICEIKGSLKIGKNIPGTEIPVVDEEILLIKLILDKIIS